MDQTVIKITNSPRSCKILLSVVSHTCCWLLFVFFFSRCSAHMSEDELPVSCEECCRTQPPVSFWLVLKRVPRGMGCVRQWDTAVCAHVCVWERQDVCISNCTVLDFIFTLYIFILSITRNAVGFICGLTQLHTSKNPQEVFKAQLCTTDFTGPHNKIQNK